MQVKYIKKRKMETTKKDDGKDADAGPKKAAILDDSDEEEESEMQLDTRMDAALKEAALSKQDESDKEKANDSEEESELQLDTPMNAAPKEAAVSKEDESDEDEPDFEPSDELSSADEKEMAKDPVATQNAKNEVVAMDDSSTNDKEMSQEQPAMEEESETLPLETQLPTTSTINQSSANANDGPKENEEAEAVFEEDERADDSQYSETPLLESQD